MRAQCLTVVLLAVALAACGGDSATTNDECLGEAAVFADQLMNNSFALDPELGAATDLVEPDFAPLADSPVLSIHGTPPAGLDTSATFAGAIGESDWTAGWTAYPVDTAAGGGATIVDVSGDITANTTWTQDNTYVLSGPVFVRDATLTIEAGTVIRGSEGSSLVITQSGYLDAAGSASEPIVFTSSKDEGAAAGDWGGIVLLGAAPINVVGGTDNIEGFAAGSDDTLYGGDDSEFDCGTLRYVRIEYGGYELSPDNELNGLTVGGCGSATTLDYIQVHKGADDGIELFGGTASLTHAVITQPDDDGLDWDFGWTGSAQFLIVQQNATVGNMAFEGDNNKNNNDAEPRSNPTIWNATLIGSGAEPGLAGKLQGAMHLRRGTAATMGGFVIAHFADFAINIEGLASETQASTGNLSLESSVFYDNANGSDFPAPGAGDRCQ